MKEISRSAIVLYCLPLFAVGLFTTMLNNYLIYFYQPTAASGLPILITQGYVFAGMLTVIGLIKALGRPQRQVRPPGRAAHPLPAAICRTLRPVCPADLLLAL